MQRVDLPYSHVHGIVPAVRLYRETEFGGGRERVPGRAVEQGQVLLVLGPLSHRGHDAAALADEGVLAVLLLEVPHEDLLELALELVIEVLPYYLYGNDPRGV